MRLNSTNSFAFGETPSGESIEKLNQIRYSMANNQRGWQAPITRENSIDTGLDKYAGGRGGRPETSKEAARKATTRETIAKHVALPWKVRS